MLILHFYIPWIYLEFMITLILNGVKRRIITFRMKI